MENHFYLLPYDLQLFGDSGDKTEDATSKKLEDTRKKGQVGKSQELTYAVELITLFVILRFLVSGLGSRFVEVFNWIYGTLVVDVPKIEHGGMSVQMYVSILEEVGVELLWMIGPFLIIGFIVAALSMGLQFRFKVTWEPLKPKLNKLNPINGFKRMFSKQALFNLGLSIAKIILIFFIAFFSIRDHISDLFLLYELDLRQAVSLVGDIIINTGLRISAVYLIVGLADFAFQKWKFKQDVKMTKQEVKDEYKNAEGDPQIKGQQRARMREASQRRMMQAVPEADVVITNPTHIAVALKYDPEVSNAPFMVAKGEQHLAERIKKAAKENNVPVHENKALARALYTTVEIGEQIPPELYEAVAKILALIFTSNDR